MVRELLIRRLLVFARRHAWDGVALGLFAAALGLGGGQIVAGAGAFARGLAPGVPAQASAPSAGAAARLTLFPMDESSRYAPQVLFPVTQHLLPLWLQLRGQLDVPPPVAARGMPAIAICIDDLGEDLAGTDRAMALPKAVALSFLPFAEATPFLAQEAEAKGHDVLAHVPMEALSPINPGPMALRVGDRDIAQRTEWNLSRVPGVVGINNHEGSRFTADAGALLPVAQVLAARHLFFFDSRTGPESKVAEVTARLGVMSAGRDIFLDDDQSEAAVKVELEALAAAAKRQGVAIAIGHPHDVTLRLLAAWLGQGHGVELISLPEAIRRKSAVTAVAWK